MNFIDKLLCWIGSFLGWLDKTTGSYTLALFIFAFVVELLLLPIAIKQQKTSIKQARLRPKEMAIRKKYAGRNDQVTQQKVAQVIGVSQVQVSRIEKKALERLRSFL